MSIAIAVITAMASVYLLFLVSVMKVKSFLSTIVFKTVPLFLSIALAFCSLVILGVIKV
jgi:hypothetical protein